MRIDATPRQAKSKGVPYRTYANDAKHPLVKAVGRPPDFENTSDLNSHPRKLAGVCGKLKCSLLSNPSLPQ